MDNLAHTLAGAALGQAGLKHRTGLGMATLLIAANLSDIDALGLLFGENLAWRRGMTHGPLAMLMLPVLLCGAIVGFDRWQARRGARPAERPEVRFRWVLVLSYIGMLSHPLLDWLNTYGIRFLMPFSDRWFYGDTLFIVDVWIWIVLGLGVWLTRRRERRGVGSSGRPALVALLVVASYGGSMHVAGRAAENYVLQELRERGLNEPKRVLASPVLVDPFRREIVFETADGYVFGDIRWIPDSRLILEPEPVPTNMTDPAVARAAGQDKAVADFLYWSRYPFATIRQVPDGIEIIIGDARYNRRPDDGPFSVRAVVPLTKGADVRDRHRPGASTEK